MTFAEFAAARRKVVFPEGEAENLVANHRKYIVDALIDIQQKVPCQRTRHHDRFPHAQTMFDCGASVFDAPRGFILSLHTILDPDCCAKVWYDPVDEDQMRCYLSDQEDCGTQFSTGYDYYYGECQTYPSAETDKSCRAGSGFFSLIDGQIYVYPQIQSDEILVVEWDGIKRAWDDADQVEWDREIEDAVELYLEAKTSRKEDCDSSKALTARGEYDEKVAMLIHQCRKERRLPPRKHCFSNCEPYSWCGTRKKSSSTTVIDEIMDPVVNNYTELREDVDPARHKSAKVLGYATKFDSGGGIFISQAQTSPAATDNDGDTIVSSYNAAYYWKKWQ